MVSAFVNSGYFDLVADRASAVTHGGLMNRNDVARRRGDPARAVGRGLLTGRTVPVQVLLNGDNANTATTVMGYAQTILQSESAKYHVDGDAHAGRRRC